MSVPPAGERARLLREAAAELDRRRLSERLALLPPRRARPVDPDELDVLAAFDEVLGALRRAVADADALDGWHLDTTIYRGGPEGAERPIRLEIHLYQGVQQPR